jgi:hypothetical protein
MGIKINRDSKIKKANLEEVKEIVKEKLRKEKPKIIKQTINADYLVYTIFSLNLAMFIGWFTIIFLVMAIWRPRFLKPAYEPKHKKKK